MELEVVYFYIHKKGGTADISPFLLEIIEDYLVILDESLFDIDELKNLTNCTVFINSSKKFEEKNVISVDATKIALDILHKPITNTAMIGALFSKFNVIDKQSIVESFKDNLSPSVVDKNVELFEEVLKEVNENEKTRA